jgi:CBS domain-containing protein
MATVKEILAKKGADVRTIDHAATVLDGAMAMNQHRIGALVVLKDDHVVGMFTERDVLRRVVGECRDPATTPISAVMTEEVACCRIDTTVEEARVAMKDRRIRHLPVIDEQGSLLGLVSIGDLNAFQATSQEQTIHLMHEYLYGRA